IREDNKEVIALAKGKRNTKNSQAVKKLAIGGILTALVVVLQMMGQFIKFGPFAISLVLIPIVLGAALCDYKIGTWLGFIFGVVVLFTDAAAFLAVSVPGTIITVLVKGILCGLVAGLVYKLFEKKNRYLAVILAAIACPLVNTGVFLLGCVVFFLDTIKEWGAAGGFENVAQFLIIGMVGLNFLVELSVNIFLSPIVVRLIDFSKKINK
ncbi:MAG: ECF transporter S component, partial [Acutalibacteraceae bacterium]|nr:ECF transporter S component [Acutalibacteraceae bacterium]